MKKELKEIISNFHKNNENTDSIILIQPEKDGSYYTVPGFVKGVVLNCPVCKKGHGLNHYLIKQDILMNIDSAHIKMIQLTILDKKGNFVETKEVPGIVISDCELSL